MKGVASILLALAATMLVTTGIAQKGGKLNKEYITKSGLKYKVTQKGGNE